MPKKLPLYTLFFTGFVSVTGDVMASLAIPWFVLQTTGSATQTGIVAFFSVSPIVLATVFGGTIVDRVGFKPVSVFADLASGVTLMLIPLLHLTVGLAFWQLLALVFLGNLLDAPGSSARSAMVPELAEAAGMSLEQATSTAEAISRATRMLGAPLAGLLMATMGALNVLWLDAVTFLISAIGVYLFIPAVTPTKENAEAETTYWDDLREGFQFVRQNEFIMMFIVVIMFTNMIDAAMSSVTLPIYIDTLYGDALRLGFVVGTFGAAALLGTVIYSKYGERFSRRGVFIGAFFVVSLRFFLFMTLPPYGVLLVFVAVTGLAAGPLNPIISVVLYEHVPAYMRARVFGLVQAGVLVAMPLGTLFAGFAITTIGLQWTLFVYGVVYVTTITTMMFLPSTHALDQPSLEV